MPPATYKRPGVFEFLTPSRKKRAFIQQLPPSARILDLGVANDSAAFVKALRPDITYVGVDVGDPPADSVPGDEPKIVWTPPEDFDKAISSLGEQQFDAVISSHNIEHCNQPKLVLQAMCAALRPGGMLFMAFPTESSVTMPSRRQTLNFFDDPTHKTVPVWRDILRGLEGGAMEVVFASKQYRPAVGFLIGLAFEPFVAPFGKKAPWAGTWALYGFESIIWAVKR